MEHWEGGRETSINHRVYCSQPWALCGLHRLLIDYGEISIYCLYDNIFYLSHATNIQTGRNDQMK